VLDGFRANCSCSPKVIFVPNLLSGTPEEPIFDHADTKVSAFWIVRVQSPLWSKYVSCSENLLAASQETMVSGFSVFHGSGRYPSASRA